MGAPRNTRLTTFSSNVPLSDSDEINIVNEEDFDGFSDDGDQSFHLSSGDDEFVDFYPISTSYSQDQLIQNNGRLLSSAASSDIEEEATSPTKYTSPTNYTSFARLSSDDDDNSSTLNRNNVAAIPADNSASFSNHWAAVCKKYGVSATKIPDFKENIIRPNELGELPEEIQDLKEKLGEFIEVIADRKPKTDKKDDQELKDMSAPASIHPDELASLEDDFTYVQHDHDNELGSNENSDFHIVNLTEPLSINGDHYSDDDAESDDGFYLTEASEIDNSADVTATLIKYVEDLKQQFDNQKQDFIQWLASQKKEFTQWTEEKKKSLPQSIEYYKSQVRNHPHEVIRNTIPALLSVLTTAQPTVSALMNPSGDSPANIGKEWWEKMSTGIRTYSVVSALSSFLVNYPFNYKTLLEAVSRVKENFKAITEAITNLKQSIGTAYQHPEKFYEDPYTQLENIASPILSIGYTLFTVFLALSGGLANGAIAYDTFIKIAEYLDGSIDDGIAGLAAMSNFTSRWTGVLRCLKTIKNVGSPDARLQLNSINKLINELNLDYEVIAGRTLQDELDSLLNNTISNLLKEKREYTKKDLSKVIKAEEKVLLELLSIQIKKDQALKHFELHSFEELLALTDTAMVNEGTLLLVRPFDFINQLKRAYGKYIEFKEQLFACNATIEEKMWYQRDLFKVFVPYLNPSPISLNINGEDVDGFYLTNVNFHPLEIIHEAGYQALLARKANKFLFRDLNQNDYDALFIKLVEKIEATQTEMSAPITQSDSQSSNPPVNRPETPTDNLSSDNKKVLFCEEPEYKTAKDWLKGGSGLLAAIIFGLAGGAVYTQKGFDGIDIIKKLLDGEKFTKEQLDDLQRFGIGIPAGLASAMLYGISAADFPKLLFTYLREAISSKNLAQWGGAAFFLVTNFFASASMQNVTSGVLSADGVLDLVKKLLSLGIFNEEQTKVIAPYIVRLGGGIVNMVPILRDYDNYKPADKNNPTPTEVFKHFADLNNHPLSEAALTALRRARETSWATAPISTNNNEADLPSVNSSSTDLPSAGSSSADLVSSGRSTPDLTEQQRIQLNRSNQRIVSPFGN